MLRSICAVFGVAVLFAPAQPDVDAVTFALAFRDGTADQYKNKEVGGSGLSFHGPVTEKIADGTTRMSLVITLGSRAPDGKLTPVHTWDEFVAAERSGTTVAVALSGPNLPPAPGAGPTTYEFSGVYDGQVRTVMRPPQADVGSEPADAGPCPGDQPVSGKGQFYCVPLLTGAVATVKGAARLPAHRVPGARSANGQNGCQVWKCAQTRHRQVPVHRPGML